MFSSRFRFSVQKKSDGDKKSTVDSFFGWLSGFSLYTGESISREINMSVKRKKKQNVVGL